MSSSLELLTSALSQSLSASIIAITRGSSGVDWCCKLSNLFGWEERNCWCRCE